MNILNYSAGADTGGQSIRFQRAFANQSDHTYHSLVRKQNYLRYPRDLAWEQRGQAISEADVIHASNSFRTLEHVRKPIIVHYHGTQFRLHPRAHINEARYRGVGVLVSTLDLYLLAPDDVQWCPAPFDLDWLATFRKPIDDGVLRIGHAPTARAIKSTDKLIAAVDRLAQTHPVELVLIERQPWADCLELKGTVDVLFDQVILGYGNNATEAWGMGLPVICGAKPDTLAEMRRRFGELPFYEATEATIYEALLAMTDAETRREWGERGRAHAERFHAEQAVVELMEPVYQAALTADLPRIQRRRQRPGQRGRVQATR